MLASNRPRVTACLFNACTNRALSEAKQMGEKEEMWPRARDAEDADAGGDC